jgi:geranylgeranyl pyrophosphate synthase
VPVMRLFAETLATIVNGEITQLFTSKGLASKEDYLQRIHAKTASMFELSTAAAALLSPVDELLVEEVRLFGYDIGMAFQIVDDVLDFTGEQAMVGKPVGSDLRQGLITLPALYYFESNPDDPDISWVLSGKTYSDERMNKLVSSIRNSEAIERSLNEARTYVDCGLEILSRMAASEERNALVDLSNYIVRRSM